MPARREMPTVYFVHTEASLWRQRLVETPGLPAARPDWFRQGTDAWVTQTWLEMRRLGLPVELVEDVVEGEVCVVHFDHLPALRRPWRCYLVAIRADHSPVYVAEQIVVQSPRLAGGVAGQTFLPHWPQPGLRPRDESRGNRVERVAYLGRPEQLLRGISQGGGGFSGLPSEFEFVVEGGNWADYSAIDVVVAIRQGIRPTYLATKPASKLVNAWLAGTAAIIGPEPSVRALRRSRLDYIEARTTRQVVDALDRLRRDEDLYRAMVRNGLERAAEHGRDRVADAWARFLEGRVRTGWRQWRTSWYRRARSARLRHRTLTLIQGLDRLRFRQMAFGSVFRSSPDHS